MNRFEYVEAKMKKGETFLGKDRSVKLFNGHEKTSFEDGDVILTTHRLFWGQQSEIRKGAVTLCLHLKYVIAVDEETTSSFVVGKKKRIILHLKSPAPNKAPGPMDSSTANFIKLSGRTGLDTLFTQTLRESIQARIWEVDEKGEDPNDPEKPLRIKLRTGILGIERSIQLKYKETDENINLAFQDLKVLMAMAKDMVNISKSISNKIREKKGDISEDETVRFKSYLMSLGIDDPVTREGFTSNIDYYKSLSNQICEILLDPIEEVGGMMSLADVYCRVNRARGLELLSPEDLLNACKLLNGPMKLREFPSGAMVLQLGSHDDEIVAQEVLEKVESSKSLSVEDLAKILGISILLAKERLLTAERTGLICRDESMEGLRFYPNLFLKSQN